MGSQCRASRSASVVLPLFLLVVACGDDGGIPDGVFNDTTTGGMGGAGGSSDTEPDAADETGTGGLQPVEERCLYEPDPKGELYGFRYQCAGRVVLDITVEHPFAGSPEQLPFELEFGDGVDGDDYHSPYVLACCPWYDPAATNCNQPHERACWVDLVEQGCKSMVGKIETFAQTTFPGVLHTAERNAVLKVADYVRDHQDQCTAAFREATDIAATQPTCDEDDNGVEYASMLEDGVWTFEPDGPVDKVEIAVTQADWYGLYPLVDPLATAICFSADDNDGTLFLEVDPAPGSIIVHLVGGRVELVGPGAAGIGVLSSTSALALTSTGETASLENLALHAAGPGVAVLATDATIPIDDFHVRLWERAPAVVDDATLTVPPASARFAVSVTALGESRVQTATNATPIVLTKEAEGWRTSAFSIDVEHRDEPWSLVVPPARWQ